ncbi:MAG: 30S ribosome-binding factor RbfA [Polyangiales bacterium]
MTEVKRSLRVGERVREELAALLIREVRDPRVKGTLVTNVAMSDDLQQAKIYVRKPDLDAAQDLVARRGLISGLQSASGLLRRELGKRLGLRYSPRLTFYYDEGAEKRDRIDSLLAEIARESPGAKKD